MPSVRRDDLDLATPCELGRRGPVAQYGGSRRGQSKNLLGMHLTPPRFKFHVRPSLSGSALPFGRGLILIGLVFLFVRVRVRSSLNGPCHGSTMPVAASLFPAPGTYVLTGNFVYTGSTAINITGPFSGPVVLNLKGHTINGIPTGTYTTLTFKAQRVIGILRRQLLYICGGDSTMAGEWSSDNEALPL